MNILRSTLALIVLILLPTGLAMADQIEVTFSGGIDWTFDPDCGSDSFHGIEIGEFFSSVLTFDTSLQNLSPDPNLGVNSDFGLNVTVQTSSGPETILGTESITVNNDGIDEFSTIDSVNNAASGTAHDISHIDILQK